MYRKIIFTATALLVGTSLAQTQIDGKRWEAYVPVCVAAGTMVELSSGQKAAIETVNENQSVVTANGAMNVIKKSNSVPNVEMYTLIDSVGNKLIATAHHPIFTKEFGFIKLSDVKSGNTLRTTSGETKVVSNSVTNYQGAVYNLSTSQNSAEDSFYGSNILIGGINMQESLNK